ncbi:MAG: hypothetical protein K1X95_05085 [Acidimicrobiia bacterium]|nr:hypothetical protein [Acidimicrobiia bacterium]
MEAMCDWCGQVVPISVDGTCFLGHPVSASATRSASAAAEIDIAAPPPLPADTVAPVPDFTAITPDPTPAPIPAPPLQADPGPVPVSLPPQPPVFAAAPPMPAAPQPPHAPIVPPPVPAPPVPVGIGAPSIQGQSAPMPSENPVDAAFAPLIDPAPPMSDTQRIPIPTAQAPAPTGPALPPQAPTGPGWQAVHIADDVAVFEYRPPHATSPSDDVVAHLPPPTVVPAPPAGQAAAPVSAADVAGFAPGDELDIPEKGSKTRQIVLLAILAVVVLAAVLAFAVGLI